MGITNRNYVLHPYKLIKDVRTGFESTDTDSVLNGELDGFLKSYLMMMGQKKKNKKYLMCFYLSFNYI